MMTTGESKEGTLIPERHKHIKLTLSVENMGQVRWWVDMSYNTHENFRARQVHL